MIELFKRFIANLLSIFDLIISRKSSYDKHLKNSNRFLNDNPSHDLQFLSAIEPSHRSRNIELLSKSKSQLRQDLFVLTELNFQCSGFFVEFGATNGIDISNSYLLEKEFQWSGILAEPARIWHKDLIKNRTAHIETKCVWDQSNQIIQFHETEDGEFSSAENFLNSDSHSKKRSKSLIYQVETISLIDMLRKFNAPKLIDYLSIDTEGSEYKILQSLDFNQYQFKVITCEHNFNENRNKIFNLLIKNGYSRKFQDISKYEDWYILNQS